MCLSLHPHNIGRSNAAKHLDDALHYIFGHDGVWNTTADDIAEYYIANNYDQVSSWVAKSKQQRWALEFVPHGIRVNTVSPGSILVGGQWLGSLPPRQPGIF